MNKTRVAFTHYVAVKEHNKSRILRTISAAPCSRIDLARLTGLSPATITSLVRELIAANLIAETGTLESVGGRRPVLLQFNPNARRAVGVSISQHRLKAAVVNLDGSLLLSMEQPLQSREPLQVLAQLELLVKEVAAAAGADWDRVAGIGLVVPGIVNSEMGQVILSTVLGWRDLPIGPLLGERLGKPVLLQRNGNAAALAEAFFGQAEVQPNLLYFNLGTGIGAGIILGGNIYSGVSGRAGEAGHIVVDPHGPTCRCGNRGCLEAMASGPAIADRARDAVRGGEGTTMLGLTNGDPQALTAVEVAAAARQGDRTAIAIMEEAGQRIGQVIAGLVNLLDIDVVALGGGLSRAGSVLLGPIERALRAGVLEAQAASLRIYPSSLGAEAGVMGAATLVIEQVLGHSETEVKSSRRQEVQR